MKGSVRFDDQGPDQTIGERACVYRNAAYDVPLGRETQDARQEIIVEACQKQGGGLGDAACRISRSMTFRTTLIKVPHPPCSRVHVSRNKTFSTFDPWGPGGPLPSVPARLNTTLEPRYVLYDDCDANKKWTLYHITSKRPKPGLTAIHFATHARLSAGTASTRKRAAICQTTPVVIMQGHTGCKLPTAMPMHVIARLVRPVFGVVGGAVGAPGGMTSRRISPHVT
jgi:hypothetical protein